MPKVSICIPTYRQVDFLRPTLLSIEAQTFDDYDLIISDDSPDDAVERLVGEFDFGKKLKYVRNTQALGSPANWNAAVARSDAPFIKMMHHDDRFSGPHALERFVGLLDDDPHALFAFSGSRVEYVTTRADRHHFLDPGRADEIRAAPASLIFGNVIGAPSATIVRRDLAIDYDVRMKWLVDIDYYIRALRIRPRFAHTTEALIVTPSEAAHQVTEQVRDDARLEIGETLMVFEKWFDDLVDDPRTDRMWFKLFRRYRVGTAHRIGEYGRVSIAMQAYFDGLFAKYRFRLLLGL